MVSPEKDYAFLNDDNYWIRDDNPGSTTELNCQAACAANAACLMARFGTSAPGDDAQKCDLLLETPAGEKAVAIKAGGDVGTDFAVYTVPAALVVGVEVTDLSSSNLTAEKCLGACRTRAQCELVTFDAAQLQNVNATGPCVLFRSDFDTEWNSIFHIQGNKLFSDLGL
jgi:hypothetical protein